MSGPRSWRACLHGPDSSPVTRPLDRAGRASWPRIDSHDDFCGSEPVLQGL
ncbi:hypothetical protein ACFFX0_22505 [Citricoccus parietis]|uniref:Uncharacterized protein n=1 Tax=Citricoccus parietis TaxID=592307 RepID=A0ABV5G4H4_9MICC